MADIDLSLIRSLSLFDRMADEDLEILLSRASIRRMSVGEAVFEQGQVATQFFLLLHGRLKVVQVTPDGQQIIVRVVHPGDLFGFAQALQRDDYPGTPVAAAESIVVCWPNEVWDSIVAQSPNMAVNAMQSIGQRLQEAHTRIREMSTEEVERRVAHAVLRLMDQAGRAEQDGVRIDFLLSRQDVAEMTGTTLYTVSRLGSARHRQGRPTEASGTRPRSPGRACRRYAVLIGFARPFLALPQRHAPAHFLSLTPVLSLVFDVLLLDQA